MKVKLPQPKVLPGQKVIVQNYRKKYNDKEIATVRSCELRVGRIGQTDKYHTRWVYTVTLERRTPSKKTYSGAEYGNRLMFLYVGDDGVEAI